MLKNDFESQNFAIFEKVVDNLGRSDNEKYLQLAQKVMNDIHYLMY